MVSHDPQVLVVDDESLIRWSIAETLARAGWSVIEAQDGAAAIRALSEAPDTVDAVVLDFRLPDSNDLSLLARIRRLSPRSAVVMMTAFHTPEVAEKARHLGAYDVLDKPFEMPRLHQVLTEACGTAAS